MPTTAIRHIGRPEAQALHDAVDAALAQVAAAHGLRWETGRALIDHAGAFLRVKGEFHVTETRDGADPRAARFAADAALFDLKPEDFGRTFTARGTAYRVVGINFKSRKYPIECERVADGKAFRFMGVRFAEMLNRNGGARN